ncbi:MAG: TonB-dependent siderophore receptor, partial [Flavobacterium sp.]
LSDNAPAENISVVLKQTSYAAITDGQGGYEIRNVQPGTYIMVVTAIGISAIEESITIEPGQRIVKNFTLKESQQELEEIIIKEEQSRFSRAKSQTVARMPLKNIENPQVYNTVTAELLREQVVSNFDDALKNVPGIDRLWESTGRGGDGAGYFSLRGFAVQPTMVNGVPGISNGSPDPQNIENIEVIKGPSGTLFGSSLISYGGLINIITKRPYDTFGGAVSYTGGTYGLNRYTVDINTPLDDNNKAAMRLNAAYHTENSFQDAGFKKSIFVAPSFSYNANDRLSFYLNAEFYNNRMTNQTMLFLDRGTELRVNNIDELNYDNKRSYTGNDLYIDTPTFNLQGQANYKISDSWTSQTIVSRTSAKSDGYYSYLYEGTQFYPDVTEGIVLGRYMNKQNAETYGTDLQQNFIGDFKIGNLRNRIVAGIDYFNRNTVNNSSAYVLNGNVYIGNDLEQFNNSVLSITNPADFTDDSGILNQPGVNALLTDSPIAATKTKEEVYSAYASNVINITPALSAMVSLRVDRFINSGNVNDDNDDYNQTTLSPKFGVVYQPILDKVSIFANYMNGFRNVAPGFDVINGETIGRTFEPEHANQFEIGTKLNLLGDKLTATFSYYDIQVDNTVYALITNVQGPDPTSTTDDFVNTINYQDGAQRNKGFEASIVANPFAGFNIIAGYSYNDSELTSGDGDFLNRRPESAGPRNLINLWASYRFQGTLDGFGLGFGGNYASENQIFNRNVGGTFTLPEYTVLNAAVFYTIENFTLTAKLDNLTDKDYYKGWSTISPQRPRMFSANLAYRF